jgi:hypothetical protein
MTPEPMTPEPMTPELSLPRNSALNSTRILGSALTHYVGQRTNFACNTAKLRSLAEFPFRPPY